jgi:ADP-ribose pyrophosphatase
MKPIKSKQVYSGSFLNIKKSTYQLENGYQTTIEHVSKDNAVGIVAYQDDLVHLVVQPRPAIEADHFIEIPAGTTDLAGESELECAKRELIEESGLTAEHWSEVLRLQTSPGCLQETITIFAATGLQETSTDLDEGEFITNIKCSWNEIMEMIASQKIQDAKTIAGLLAVYQSLQENK